MYSQVLLLACSIAWDTGESKLILPRSRGVAGDPIPTPVGRISNCCAWTIVSLFFLFESSSASIRRSNAHQSCATCQCQRLKDRKRVGNAISSFTSVGQILGQQKHNTTQATDTVQSQWQRKHHLPGSISITVPESPTITVH